jgi:hypothetical protein
MLAHPTTARLKLLHDPTPEGIQARSIKRVKVLRGKEMRGGKESRALK